MTVNVSDWSETPASNVTVDGISIAENCSPQNLNNSDRAIMAGVRTFYTAYLAVVATLSNYMAKAGGTFSGTQPIYTGEGAFLHHQGSSYTSGKVYMVAEGSGDPSGTSTGDIVIFYTP
jgi:hypothetical protein